jgi:hypothetical protein
VTIGVTASVHGRERALRPMLALGLQELRFLRDDFDQDQKLLPQSRIPDLVEGCQELPGLIDGVRPAFSPRRYACEQASEKFVDLFMRNHHKRLTLNATQHLGLYNRTFAILSEKLHTKKKTSIIKKRNYVQL